MTASKQIDPPAQFKPQGIGELVIGVRIFVRRDALSPYFFPEHNRIGTEMLCSLLQARIELAGVRVTQSAQGFPFNGAACTFTVSKLVPALEAVKAEMEKLILLTEAQVAWLDPREDVWRVWHSKSGRYDPPSDEEFASNGKILDALTNAAKKLPVLKDEPSGQ